MKYHENPKSPSLYTSLFAVYSALNKKLTYKKCSPFISFLESKRMFLYILICLRYHDFRDTPISTHFSCIFLPLPISICVLFVSFSFHSFNFSLFPMYQGLVYRYRWDLIHRKQWKNRDSWSYVEKGNPLSWRFGGRP